MKPAYWIGILTLVGVVLAYTIYQLTGWLDARTWVMFGILVSALIYCNFKDRLHINRHHP
jgi:4-hydroxybenzoate polyprenyltransferase